MQASDQPPGAISAPAAAVPTVVAPVAPGTPVVQPTPPLGQTTVITDATPPPVPDTPVGTPPPQTPAPAPSTEPVTDLTFEQLSAQLPDNAIVNADGATLINVSVLLESDNSSLAHAGVVEVLYQLMHAAAKAQTEVNKGVPEGQTLNAFGLTTAFPAPGVVAASARLDVQASIGDNLVDLKGRLG